MRTKKPKNSRQEQSPQHQQSVVEVDVESLVSIENQCNGCAGGQKCCCSSYEVCVTTAEMKRIIRVLPEAAKFSPNLLTSRGYDNMFEQEEPDLFSIDTDEDGLCVFAYWSQNRVHCSLHSAAAALGLSLEQVKPKVCLLWPMHFSDGDEVLGAINDAFLFECNTRKARGSRKLSSGFVQVLELVYGEGCGTQVEQAAENGERRTLLVTRR